MAKIDKIELENKTAYFSNREKSPLLKYALKIEKQSLENTYFLLRTWHTFTAMSKFSFFKKKLKLYKSKK